ncbi:hypothetical protein HOD29_06635 [archaeon]|jgi:hypothetical protein|nr:hypothetical protein [archaeon]
MRRYIRDTPEKNITGIHSKETISKALKNKNKARRKKYIKLISRRSTRVGIYGPCSLCGFKTDPLWYYAKSSVGQLYLCVRCKTKKVLQKKESKSNLSRKDEEQMKKNLFYKTKIKLSGQIDSNKQRH